MKKILNTIMVLCALIVSLSGCKIAEEDHQEDVRGICMFKSWNVAMDDVTDEFLDVTFRFNAWYMLPDSMRPIVKDLYFPNYNIRQNGENSWKLEMNGKLQYVVETDGQTLARTGSHWTVTSFVSRCGTYVNMVWNKNVHYRNSTFSFGNIKMDIQTLQPYQWKIVVNPQEQYGQSESFMDLVMTVPSQEMPTIVRKSSYQLTGNGRFSFVDERFFEEEDNQEEVYLDFDITEPLLRAGRNVSFWESGIIALHGWSKDGRERTEIARLSHNDEEGYVVSFLNNDYPQDEMEYPYY